MIEVDVAAFGDHRNRYSDDKRREFAVAGGDHDGERLRISIIDDFLGRPVGQPRG